MALAACLAGADTTKEVQPVSTTPNTNLNTDVSSISVSFYDYFYIKVQIQGKKEYCLNPNVKTMNVELLKTRSVFLMPLCKDPDPYILLYQVQI